MPKTETFIREEVLERVVKVFWDKGYNGASMQDIVDASGLNRSSLYNSFGDKHALFMTALKHYQEQHHKHTVSRLKSGQSPRKIIKSILESGTIEPNEDNRKGCLFVNCTPQSTQSDEVKDFLTDNMKVMVSFLTELVREGQRLQEFSKSFDPKTLALYFFSALQGLKTTSLLIENQEDIEEVIETILSKQ